MDKELILTVGLPRSGKSTWAKTQNCPIVNPDSIRLALYNQPFIQEAEDFIWAIAYIMVKALFLSGHKKVIVDATNLWEEGQNKWYIRFPDCKITLKHFNTSMEECIRRAKLDEREDLIPVIERMADLYTDKEKK